MTACGRRPASTIPKWSSNFAYAVGLLVTDGNLSKDGRHITLTSADEEQLRNFSYCIERNLPIRNVVTSHTTSTAKRIQFSDVTLYKFLLSIGVTPNKSLTVGKIDIPPKFFWDFLRGHHDGDGCFYSYFDPRWPNSFMFYLAFLSASQLHIEWIRSHIKTELGVSGKLHTQTDSSVIQLRYAKAESLKILNKMYENPLAISLSRKRLKIEAALRIVGESLPSGSERK